MAGKLIYGGTFNPVHIGHLRMAIEARELLGGLVRQVEFVPAYHQPLKSPKGILSFELRVELLKRALADLPGFFCNEIEKERKGPSYTYDTLKDYPGTCRNERFFLLGSQDFEKLPLWHRGMDLPEVANLVIVPRDNFEMRKFFEVVKGFWGNGESCYLGDNPAAASISLNNGSKIFYFELPKLQISATQIRYAWIKGKNIDWLTPKKVKEHLDKNRENVMRQWEQSAC